MREMTALIVLGLSGSMAMAGDSAYYLNGGSNPWGSTDYATAMDTNFGMGGWTQDSYSFVDPGTLFSSASFIYMEGSDASASELASFLSANGAALEAWVSGGGTLLLNAAPNGGANINFGFGGVLLTYPDFGPTADAVDPNHPIFNGPFGAVATSYTGNSFSHAHVTGGGSAILVDDTGDTTLSEMTFGAGGVLFGGMTAPQFHDPDPDSLILLENIIAYTTTVPAPGALALFGLGGLAMARRRR